MGISTAARNVLHITKKNGGKSIEAILRTWKAMHSAQKRKKNTQEIEGIHWGGEYNNASNQWLGL